MAEYREFHCPYGDDFEGGDECDRCEQYELCMETYPPLNIIEIPKGATNGDMIKAMFPNLKIANDGLINDNLTGIMAFYGGYGSPLPRGNNYFNRKWWNAPYKSNCIPSEYDLSEDIELSNPQMYR